MNSKPIILTALLASAGLGLTFAASADEQPTAFPRRHSHTSVVFKNKLWVMGGEDGVARNDVWNSADGRTWTQVTDAAAFSARTRNASVVFNNRLWVIGGIEGSNQARNDIWSSGDGATWTRVTAAAAFPARQSHTSVVFNKKIWVIGGSDGDSQKNDVWSSLDGVTWTRITAEAAFSARAGHTSVVFNKKIWVIGGSDNSSHPKNDVWSSADGVTWTQATSAAAFSARAGHTSSEVSCLLNDRKVSPYWLDKLLVIDKVKAKDLLTIEFPMVEQTVTYAMNTGAQPGNQEAGDNVEYKCTMKGNTLIDISPREKDEFYPIFLRDEYKQNKAPMKKVKRFVADTILRWH